MITKKRLNFTLLVIFFVLLIFTRFYNLQNTARFIWDESSDLVKIHQYFVEKKITLVGPISEDGNKVFSSLTYYLLMPFAILGNFDPLSPVIGSAFFGVLTGLLLFLLFKKIDPKLPAYLYSPLILFWFPLVETSRWAWNPNFIPFWTVLALLAYQNQVNWAFFLTGLFLGLTIHHHYLALFSVGAFSLVIFIQSFKKNQLRKFFLYAFGVFLTILPFVLFDLRHPPGLFLTRIFFFNQAEKNFGFLHLANKSLGNFQQILFYFTQSKILSFIFGWLVAILFILDIKAKSRSFDYALPWLFQILGLSFIANVYNHYFLPSLIFFVVWLLYPRKKPASFVVKISLIILTLGAIFSVTRQLTNKSWQTDIKSVKSITAIIVKEISSRDLKNNNLAVLVSPDNNIYGRRFRDLLLIKNVALKTKEEYQISDHLFVISTGEEKQIRNDPAPEISSFRSGSLQGKWGISNSPWTVYLFDRNKEAIIKSPVSDKKKP